MKTIVITSTLNSKGGFMIIQTRSGSEYNVAFSTIRIKSGDIQCLHAFRYGVDGENWDSKCVAVYPDRVDHFLDSKSFENREGKLVGLNENGNVTCQFYPEQVKVGMVLVSPKGFRSTTITKIM